MVTGGRCSWGLEGPSGRTDGVGVMAGVVGKGLKLLVDQTGRRGVGGEGWLGQKCGSLVYN